MYATSRIKQVFVARSPKLSDFTFEVYKLKADVDTRHRLRSSTLTYQTQRTASIADFQKSGVSLKAFETIADVSYVFVSCGFGGLGSRPQERAQFKPLSCYLLPS